MLIPIDCEGRVSAVDYGVFAITTPWNKLVTVPSQNMKTHLSGDAPAYMVVRLNDGAEYATKGFTAVQNGEFFESFAITDKTLAEMLLAKLPPHYLKLSEVNCVGVLCPDDESGKNGCCLYAELSPDSGYPDLSMEDFYFLDVKCVYWDVTENLPYNLIYKGE